MKISIFSDLHLDFLMDKKPLFDLLKFSMLQSDLSVVAGDVCPIQYWVKSGFIDLCNKVGKPILMVLGNHEYYNRTWLDVKETISELIKDTPIILLDNQEIKLLGNKIYGGSLWFPRTVEREINIRLINDSKFIPEYISFCEKEYNKFIENIDNPDIIISHHLPSRLSVPQQYKYDSANCYFFSNELVHKYSPELWIHGHTHTSCDYTSEGTRVICNPLGYPKENMSWLPLEIEI